MARKAHWTLHSTPGSADIFQRFKVHRGTKLERIRAITSSRLIWDYGSRQLTHMFGMDDLLALQSLYLNYCECRRGALRNSILMVVLH